MPEHACINEFMSLVKTFDKRIDNKENLRRTRRLRNNASSIVVPVQFYTLMEALRPLWVFYFPTHPNDISTLPLGIVLTVKC